MSKIALAVTSVSAPNPALRLLAAGCLQRSIPFYCVGDAPSPPDFQLDGCDFYPLDRQRSLDLLTPQRCPVRHYARKNIAYLLAMRNGAEVIVETDDDNLPIQGFWQPRARRQSAPMLRNTGWTNIYRYFSKLDIWPRGLPLDCVRSEISPIGEFPRGDADCPIQQGLSDANPDVDAIYRLILPLPVHFDRDRAVALGAGAWCPFNSQNTTWWADAFPLLYLPAYCSFRMTDIWRSFVAQRIAWANEWSVLFHSPTMSHERNEHNMMRDFADEVPGYLNNRRIGETLDGLSLPAGTDHIPENLLRCYEALTAASILDSRELPLVESWLLDLASCRPVVAAAGRS